MKLFVREKYFYERFFSLTITIALQNVIVFGVNLADNVMLGRYTESALSGVALVNQIQFLLQMFVMGIGEGLIIIASRAWGAKDTDSIKRALSVTMRLCLGVTAALFFTVLLLPHQVMSLFSNDEAVLGEAVRYLRIICFSYPFFAVTNMLLCGLRSVETVKIGFYVSLTTLFTNVALNYILIFGKFGAPRLGAEGAAIATLISRVIETAIVIIFAGRFDRKLTLRLRDFKLFDRAVLVQYLRVGSPVFWSSAMWGAAMAVQTAILGHMGSATIAANSIATTVFQILSVVTYGSASATAVIIAKTIGEGRVGRVREYAVTAQILFLIIGVLTGLMVFVCKDLVISFYDISAQARALAVQFMTVLSVTVVGTSYQMAALTGIVRGGGDTKFVLINDLIFMWGIVLPTSWAAAFWLNLPPLAVFICLKSDQILKCFVAVVKVNRFRWIKTNT